MQDAMQDAHGEMLDRDGTSIYVGQRAIDRIFGECTVLGRVPIEAGVGFNVSVKWAKDHDVKPSSRRSQMT